MILITGYSVVLRARVIGRLAELEAQLAHQPSLPAPPTTVEPSADLFPATPVERMAATALAQIKLFGASIRDTVWQSKQAISQQIETSDQQAKDQRRYIAEQTLGTRKDIQKLEGEVKEFWRYLPREPDWSSSWRSTAETAEAVRSNPEGR